MRPSAISEKACLLLLLAAALLLRMQSWHPFVVVDENAILSMVWGLHYNFLPPGMPPPHPGYPPLFIYLNFLLSLLLRELLMFWGAFSSTAEFLVSPAARHMTLKAGQILVAVLGTVHVVVIWKIGREFFDRRVAWLAALLIAFHPHLILNSHIFKSDIPLALLFSLLIFFALRFLHTLAGRDFLTASFLVGLIAACKYNGAVQALLIPALIWMSRKQLAPGRWLRLLLLAPPAGLAGFLLLAPNWAVHPLASFQAAYRYAFFHFREFAFYDRVSSTYGRYLADLWQTLGPVFVVLIVLGLLGILARRKKEEVTIALSLALYYLVQGSSVFYGSRIILPILGAASLIAAIAAFRHLGPHLKSPTWRRVFTLAVFLAALLLSLGHARDSLSLYNLWKTSSTLEEASAFRTAHIPSGFPFGREIFTPDQARDQGRWDITDLPRNLFRGPGALPFLSTGLLTDHILNRSQNRAKKEEAQFRLREYRAFHRIAKPRFSPWDGDIIFWYRPNPRLGAVQPRREPVQMPRLCRAGGTSTLFYPLQAYEKDPGFFRLQGGYSGKWILSSRPLSIVSLTLFCPAGDAAVTVKLNERTIRLHASSGAVESVFAAPAAHPCHPSPLYRLEAQCPADHPPLYLWFRDGTAEPAARSFILSGKLDDDPPALFSQASPPAWAKELYRRTGVDVQLLAFTQELTLWENHERSLLPFVSEWTVLPRGAYRWEMESEPLLEGDAAGDPPPLCLEFFHGERPAMQTLAWERVSPGHYALQMEPLSEAAFVRARPGDFRKHNLVLRRLCLRPDYLRSLRQGVAGVNPPPPAP